jgi:hypothetical protein
MRIVTDWVSGGYGVVGLCLLLLGLPGARAAEQSQAVVLVADGKPECRIVVAKDAAEPERFAASELSRYVQEMSGGRLPVVEKASDAACEGHCILLGSEAPHSVWLELSQQGEDAFIIRTVKEGLILSGASPRSTLYAVYAFLEETVPKRRTIRLEPVNRMEKPSFTYRAILTFPLVRDRAVCQIDWLAKNRLNWVHLITNTDLSIWEKEEVRKVLMPEIRKRGIHVEGIGHSFYAYVPPKKYFAEHPEYFAMMDGKRADTHPRGATLCVSNPEVVKLMAENMSAFLRENPEIDIIDLWNNDGLGWCECPNCRVMNGLPANSTEKYRSTTRSYIRFVNAVGKRLAKEHPRVMVNALAYGFNLHAAPDAPPGANVVVGIAPWSRVSYAESDDYYVPIAEPGPVNDYLRIAIPGWAGQTKRLYIYDYYANRNEFFPIIDTLRKDYAYYQGLGIDMVSSETYMWDDFNLWAYSRLAWNPRMPLKKIVADFCAIAYRDAAAPMVEFHTELERHKWEWPKHRAELGDLLKKAQTLAAASDDATIVARLGRLAKLLAGEPQKTWPHAKPPPPLGD